MGWSIGDVLSGGVTKIFDDDSDLGVVAQGLLSPLSGGLTDVYGGIKKYNDTKGKWYEKLAAGVDRGIDVGGTLDRTFRNVGNDLVPENWKPYAQGVGATVGGIVGSYVPVLGTAVGAAIGSGVGSKLQGDNYSNSFLNAGKSYALGKVAQGASRFGGASDAGNAINTEIGGDYSNLGEGFQTPYQGAGEVGTGGFLDTAGNIVKDTATTLGKGVLKDYAVNALSNLMTGGIPEYNPMQTQTIPNYGQIPISTVDFSAPPPTESTQFTSNVEFAKPIEQGSFEPSQYTADYSNIDEKKAEIEKKKNYLADYIKKYQKRDFLSKYLA